MLCSVIFTPPSPKCEARSKMTIHVCSFLRCSVLLRVQLYIGVGIAMFLASVAVALYYNMIIAWTVYYTYSSMTSDLPWQYCNHDYNSPSE